MDKLFERVILDNTIGCYLITAIVLLVAFFVRKRIARYLALLLFHIISNAKKQENKEAFTNLIEKPIDVFLLLFTAFTVFDKLEYPTVLKVMVIHQIPLKLLLDSSGIGAMILSLVWLCLRMIDFVALILEQKENSTNNHNQFVVFFRDFFKVIIGISGCLLLLHFCFFANIGNLFTGLSIVGAALALATKESLENLIASFIIFFDRPFAVGETIKVQNLTGTIEKIGLRSTRIRTLEKTFITVPNKQMVDSIVDNLTLRTQRKVELRLELEILTSSSKILTLVKQIKKMFDEKPEVERYMVFLSDTGKNAHILTVDYFTKVEQTIDEFNALKELVNITIINYMEESQINLSAKYARVHIASQQVSI